MANKTSNIPLAVDAKLKAEIVRVAKARGTTQAETMREALRLGLHWLEVQRALKDWLIRQSRGKA